MSQPLRAGLFQGYDPGLFYDEMFRPDGTLREHSRRLYDALNPMNPKEFGARRELADLTLTNQGITFTVYGDEQGVEKPFPVDLVPRVIPTDEWDHLERGLVQRVMALNLFLQDVYHGGEILKAGKIPGELILGAPHYRRKFVNPERKPAPPVQICGTDLIRDQDGTFLVLEDNCRTPSGVSYMVENRLILTRVFPTLFRDERVRPVADYPAKLLEVLRSFAPSGRDEPNVVLMTPGMYNSAYFEHAFLAQQMGIELVEGRDLYVDDNAVYVKTTRGRQRVDVIYRRVDDDYLDPMEFRPESALGVTGISNVVRSGGVSLTNGIGTGVADDKSVYPYVPEMIRFYLQQEPILAQVPTYSGWREDDRRYMAEHADELVFKATNESGGYGMLIGPQASASERAAYLERMMADPGGYVAQPLVSLSRAPCYVDDHFEGRHVDLRPYVLVDRDLNVTVTPGGLTRVALVRGSYVVNSSQGGGSKDTWVLAE